MLIEYNSQKNQEINSNNNYCYCCCSKQGQIIVVVEKTITAIVVG